MNDPVAILKRDHRDVAQMLKTLDASKPGARRRQTVDRLTQALELIWVRVRRLNRYVEEHAPWKLAKDPAETAHLETVLRSLHEATR